MFNIVIKLFFMFFVLQSNIVFAKEENKKLVSITQIVEHPSLDSVRHNAIKTIKNFAAINNMSVDFVYESAQGNIGTANQIGKKFLSQNPDIILTISTPSTQAIINAQKQNNIPIVFAAITNPEKTISNLDKKNIFGISDEQPIDLQVKFMQQIMAGKKNIGYIFNPGELNSVQSLERFIEYNTEFRIIKIPVIKSSEISSSLQKHLNKIDAIYVPLDNTVVSAFQSLIKITNKAKIPVFTSDPDLVTKGALASVGFSYADVGVAVGNMINKIITNEQIAKRFYTPSKVSYFFNNRVADKLNVQKLNSNLDIIYID